MTKKILITGCKDGHRWYANKIGQTVDFICDTIYGEYKSREDFGYINFVQHEDGVIVEVDVDVGISTGFKCNG